MSTTPPAVDAVEGPNVEGDAPLREQSSGAAREAKRSKRMMFGRKLLVVMALAAVVIVGAMLLIVRLYAPRAASVVDRQFDTSGLQQVGFGELKGQNVAYDASGKVTLYRGDGRAVVRFEKYDATNGPEVFAYVSTNPFGDYDKDTATKLRVEGGSEGGQATLRGNFSVELDDSIDVEKIRSVVIYCERLDETYGRARISRRGY